MTIHENLDWIDDGKILAGAFAFINKVSQKSPQFTA